MNNYSRLSAGFTLIELLVVIAVVGILASIALPSFRSLTQSQQVKAASFEMYAAFSLARSEAIKRNSNVTVAPNSAGWQAGWTISGSGIGGTETIKSHGTLKGSIVTGGPTGVVYASSGRVAGTTSPAFQIDVASSATANVRCIKIDLSGMPRTVKGAC